MNVSVKNTAKKLIVRAAHPSTTPQEAIGALNLLHRQLNAQGLSIEALLSDAGEAPMPPAAVDFLRKISMLEATLRERDATVASLEKELKDERSKKKTEIAAPKTKSTHIAEADDLDFTYDGFQSAAIRKFKKVHGWQTIFCHHADVKRATIQQWRQKGIVSEDAYDLLNGITVVDSPTKKTAWTDVELSRCIALCKSGDKTDEQVATTLTKEFGRRITANSIAGTKNRLRLQGKL